VDVLEKHRLLAGQALEFAVKVQGVIHSDQVKELAERLKGKSHASQLKKIRDDYAAVFREMEQLKASKAGDSTTYDSEIVRERIREQEKAFARIQQQEIAFYERLLKGKELHAKAEQQLAEQRNRPQKQSATLNAIFEDILHQGHEIRIGEPEVKARLEEKGQADLYFPLSITGNAAVRGRVKEGFASLGGEISNATYRKMEQRLANIWFVLEVTLADGSSRGCYVPTHLSKFQTDGEFISMEEGQSRWKIRIAMPIAAIKDITTVRGRFMESMPGSACGVSRG
jgi:flagellar biosynthesis GTPase FlhF